MRDQLEPPKKFVLVVEDDDQLREAELSALADKGFITVGCATVAEAASAAGNQKFDCILLDIELRGVRSDKFLLSLRKNREAFNRRTPVIVISGILDAELVRSLAHAIDGAFVKPYDMDQVLGAVYQLCGMGSNEPARAQKILTEVSGLLTSTSEQLAADPTDWAGVIAGTNRAVECLSRVGEIAAEAAARTIPKNAGA